MENNRMLTTFDNPFNPFVDFSSWYKFDCEKGYNTCSRLARLMNTNSEMTEKETNEEKERAMNFIEKYDLQGIFFKGTEEQIDAWLKLNDKSYKSDKKLPETAENV